jgi:integrase
MTTANNPNNNLSPWQPGQSGNPSGRPRGTRDLASLMIAQGVQSREVMEQLGHSTIVMTLNRYAHIFQESQRETAKKMGEILTG